MMHPVRLLVTSRVCRAPESRTGHRGAISAIAYMKSEVRVHAMGDSIFSKALSVVLASPLQLLRGPKHTRDAQRPY